MECYYNALHGKPVADQDKMVLSKKIRKDYNKKYYRLYNRDQKKKYKSDGKNHYFNTQKKDDTSCGDCCVIVIIPSHIRDCFIN